MESQVRNLLLMFTECGPRISTFAIAREEPVENFLAPSLTVHTVVVATQVTTQSGLKASLLLANAQVAGLREKLTEAAEKARKYLAGELHDDGQQILFGLSLSIAASRGEVGARTAAELIGGWMLAVQTAMKHLHALTVALRKPVIDHKQLPSAIRSYVETLHLAPNQKVLFETDANIGALTPNVATACFRIFQEAVGNAIKHSRRTNPWVRLGSSVDRLTVSIGDDAEGFDVKEARAHAVGAGSIGLSSMRERAALAGEHFGIQSVIGHGTKIHASFPLETDYVPSCQAAAAI